MKGKVKTVSKKEERSQIEMPKNESQAMDAKVNATTLRNEMKIKQRRRKRKKYKKTLLKILKIQEYFVVFCFTFVCYFIIVLKLKTHEQIKFKKIETNFTFETFSKS